MPLLQRSGAIYLLATSPLSGLDLAHMEQVAIALWRLEGRAVVVVTHDPGRRVAPTCRRMEEDGSFVDQGVTMQAGQTRVVIL